MTKSTTTVARPLHFMIIELDRAANSKLFVPQMFYQGNCTKGTGMSMTSARIRRGLEVTSTACWIVIIILENSSLLTHKPPYKYMALLYWGPRLLPWSKLSVLSALHTITGYNQLKPTLNTGTATKAKTTEEPKCSQNIQERGIISLDIAGTISEPG